MNDGSFLFVSIIVIDQIFIKHSEDVTFSLFFNSTRDIFIKVKIGKQEMS